MSAKRGIETKQLTTGTRFPARATETRHNTPALLFLHILFVCNYFYFYFKYLRC